MTSKDDKKPLSLGGPASQAFKQAADTLDAFTYTTAILSKRLRTIKLSSFAIDWLESLEFFELETKWFNSYRAYTYRFISTKYEDYFVMSFAYNTMGSALLHLLHVFSESPLHMPRKKEQVD